MNFSKGFKVQQRLRKEFGDDLVYSLALDNKLYVLAISTHKSTRWQFNTGRTVQSTYFTEKDLDNKLDAVVDTVIKMYKTVLVPKEVTEDSADDVDGGVS